MQSPMGFRPAGIPQHIMNPTQLTPEQVNGFIQSAKKKKDMGATEESDPEYARLMQVLRSWTQVQGHQATGDTKLTPQQLATLKFQIQSYKHLSNNEPLPPSLQQLLYENNTEETTQNVAQKVVETTVKLSQQNAYAAVNKPVTASEHAQRLLVPSLLPPAVDPVALMKEKERFIRARVDYRIEELTNLPSNVTNNEDAKLKALIELKSLQLLDKQRSLRAELLTSLSKSTTLTTAIDRSSFRRMKKQSLREARQTEKQERALRGEKEKRERQKHLDYINSILAHGRDFLTAHRHQAGRMVKLGAAVMRFHSAALKEEERRLQKHSQERLNALKANDEEAYMRLLDKTKDTRITTILEQTNQFLTTLTNAVEKQKSSVQEVDVSVLPPSASISLREDEEEEGVRDYYATAHRIQEEIHEQSSLLVGGTLKDYQIKGLQWMVSLYNNRLNGILADEMGLGKTIQTLALITYLIEKKKQPGPFLVIVPLSTMTNWVLEFEKWAPSVVKIVYKGSPNERKNLSNLVRVGNFNVLLTTYEYIINPKDRPILSKIKWVHMIIDEGHRMKNANSKLALTLMQFYSSRYRLILTGTPLQNNLPELWALLNFILPKIFNSVKSFDEWFNSPFNASSIQERIELNEEEQLLIIRRLHKVLRPFLLRRLKKDVEADLPDKVEIVIKCPMSALQHRLTEQIKNRKFGNEGFTKKKALNNLVMQFRKICNHPYVFDEVEDIMNPGHITDRNLFRVSGKFELLDRILPKFQVKDHRVLMFFQMTQIMDIMEDYLRWKNFSFLRLDGHTKADDRTEMLTKFNKSENPPFIFLLSTRAGGLGLNLQTADTVIIYDSDWNPHQDLQAQDRAHRIGQKKEVRILRLVTSKSVEETILARAQYKLDIDGKVIQAGKFDNKTSDREREELLRSLFGNEDEDPDEKNDEKEGEIEDADLNEIIARNEEELELYNKMDAERRAAEQASWEFHGGVGPVPPRLMQDSELPEIFLKDPNDDKPVEILHTGRGARQRKDVAYDDGLNEDQWLNAVDDGDLNGFIARKKARQAEIRARKERQAAERKARRDAGEIVDSDEDEYEDPLELPDPDPDVEIPKKRAVRQKADDGQQKKKRGRAKKHFAGVDPEMQEVLDPDTRENYTRIFKACYKAVEELEVEVEGYTRKRSELFLQLPDRQDYADYYKFIQNPIALDMIAHRINSPYYTTVNQFVNDMNLMFNNALQYNLEGSDVYHDAIAMREAFQETLSREFQSVNQKRPRVIEDDDEFDGGKRIRPIPNEEY
ncbi:hypothetical protein HDV04_003518 [Boothiomyces sp. JEL0838]|nr:hypothetical protein HDV04_003518 [Boothiomyces sp. JEL0838]